MKPIIVYVDDEPRNLTTFELSVPENWKVHTFDSAIEALKVIREINPWVIVSDQKMPKMTGLEFLEVAVQLVPKASRVIVTGQTEERTIIQLLRRAKIYDYITKPWDTEDLVLRLQNAVDYYKALADKEAALSQLQEKNAELEKKNVELKNLATALETANHREKELREEVEAWAPAPIVWALKERKIEFPLKKDVIGIVFDVIDSGQLHGQTVGGISVLSHIIQLFTKAVIGNGGIRESHSGDSAYAHFGAFELHHDSQKRAIASAQAFRVGLRSFSSLNNIPVECGIALHFAPQTLIQVHEIKVDTPQGFVMQKSFDSTSNHIDLLHRMEKLSHDLPGSNIVLSEDFVRLIERPSSLVKLGSLRFKGQDSDVTLYIIPSDRVTKEILAAFIEKHFAGGRKHAA